MEEKKAKPILLYQAIQLQSHEQVGTDSLTAGPTRNRMNLDQELEDPIEDKQDEEEQLPPEMVEKLNQLAGTLLTHWEINVNAIELIQGGQMALVWKLATDKGPLCLKRIHRPEKKALFSIYAQDYLAKKGCRVPGIIANKSGSLYTKQGPFLYVVYDWIVGRVFNDQIEEDLTWMMKGLADYHTESIGYQPPEGTPVFSKLGKWPSHYIKRCQQMDTWKLIAEQFPDDPFSTVYLQEIDAFIRYGEALIDELNHSYYFDWVKKVKEAPNLCHQDYGTGNTLLSDLSGNTDIWLIDLDTTTFDLPIRDIRKIVIPLMNDRGAWDADYFHHMIASYENFHPLTPEEKRVLYIDMLFPYELYSVVQSKFGRKGEASVDELEQAFAFERTKKDEITRILLTES